MQVRFNDSTEFTVQQVKSYGDYVQVLTVSVAPETLREMFEDAVKTKKITVIEKNQVIAEYEGYTTFHHTEEYPGKVYGVVNYRPEKTPEILEEVQAAAVDVARIQAQSLTDEQALTVTAIYPDWNGEGVAYLKDYKVKRNGELYKCLQAHTSQQDWTPEEAPSLWAKILPGQSGEIGEWEQPDSTNPYMKGDTVTHNGKTWESLVDNNVWEPGATGTESLWKEVTG